MNGQNTSRVLVTLAQLVLFASGAQAQAAPAPTPAVPEKRNIRTARVYEIGDAEKRTIYTYKTWYEVSGDETMRRAVFVTRDSKVALDEGYWSGPSGFKRYELNDFERNRVTSVAARDGKLHYELTEKGKTKTGSEDLEPLHTIGPGLMERLLGLWDKALAGESVDLRLSVPDRFESFWFHFRKTTETDSDVVFELKPSSFIIAMFVKVIRFTFDKKTKLLKHYSGPTFVTRLVGGEWQQLQAVMEYDMTEPASAPAQAPNGSRN